LFVGAGIELSVVPASGYGGTVYFDDSFFFTWHGICYKLQLARLGEGQERGFADPAFAVPPHDFE
jgi:hypothetical protein